MRTAIIAATVTMLVSAAGASAAFVVTSKNIKNGTIQLIDISAGAKRALKGRRGPAGPEGPSGPNGTFTAQNVTLVTGPTATMPPGAVRSSIANCPTNGVPIGGGWYAGSDPPFDATVVESTRILGSWIVTMKNNSTFTASFQTTANCAIPASSG